MTFLEYLFGGDANQKPDFRLEGVRVNLPEFRSLMPRFGVQMRTDSLFAPPSLRQFTLAPRWYGLQPFRIKMKPKGQEASRSNVLTGLTTMVSQSRLEGALKWRDQIQKAAQEHGIPWELLAAVVAVESGGDQSARSPAGAVGLAQVMPQYHAQRASKYGGDLSDPQVNLLVAAEILKENYQRYGDWDKAIAAYFGAIDTAGNITDARDAVGTSGTKYVKLVKSYWDVLSGKRGNLWSVTGGQQYPVTQEYGTTDFARTSGFYQSGSHPGLDIGVPLGTTIYAPVAGTVEVAGDYGGYGLAVGIRTGDGHFVLLGHLGEVHVKPGQVVSPGTVIGKSGNTGASTGPHLHVEVRTPSGATIDPRQYLG